MKKKFLSLMFISLLILSLTMIGCANDDPGQDIGPGNDKIEEGIDDSEEGNGGNEEGTDKNGDDIIEDNNKPSLAGISLGVERIIFTHPGHIDESFQNRAVAPNT